MCYRVECGTCGRYTWGGCGKHLTTLYGSIDEGMRCMCRSWPGVVIRRAQAAEQPAQPNNPAQGPDLSRWCTVLKDLLAQGEALMKSSY